MNKMILKRFTLLVTLASLVVIAGCEIAVDFDRTKINPPDTDGAVGDAAADTSVPDTGVDTGAPIDTDGGADGSTDAAVDADAS